jgi:hypothetical protein
MTASSEPLFHPCPTDPACPYCNGTAGEGALDWSFLQAAYCISLKSREDRAAEAAAEFHKTGLCRHVTFLRPDKHPKNGFIGGWAAHRTVALDSLARGCDRTLIMEDDVLFKQRLQPRTLQAIAQALGELPPDWMIFFLGHWPLAAYFVRCNVLRTASACSHAYIASPRLLRWLADHPFEAPGIDKRRIAGKGVDAAYAMLPDTFAFFPMIAIQRVGRSDNFVQKKKEKWRLRHLVTRSGYREVLISKLMRPAEALVVLLSPAFFLSALLRGDRTSLRGPTRRSA